jgi:hypothetical protein
MTMQEKTAQYISVIENTGFFHSVGTPVDGNVLAVNSWAEAVESQKSPVWEILGRANYNRIGREVKEKQKEAFEKWNELADGIKSLLDPIIAKKIGALNLSEELSVELFQAVSWDLSGLCLESEYSEFTEPGFFHDLMYWYKKGRFPCGWKIEYPGGKLIIF